MRNITCHSLENQDDIDDPEIKKYHQNKMFNKAKKLSELPENKIYMIPNSPSKNDRMTEQEGMFIYDMQHYSPNSLYGTNFEDFISKMKIVDAYQPSLIKVHISKEHTNSIRKFLADYKIDKESLGLLRMEKSDRLK